MITKKDKLIQHMRDFYNNLTDEQVTERFIELGFERVGSGKGEITFEMKNMDEIVQYFVVNSEINMSPGKLAAQVAHVATIIAVANHKLNDDIFVEWLNNGQKKIILRGKKKYLLKLINQGFYYIRDNGLTELEPGTLTVVGLPPMYKSEAQKYVKRLQLY